MRPPIAHVRQKDKQEQSLEAHLFEVGAIAASLAKKIGMEEVGLLLGLMHDFGKYSEEFQVYLRSGTGLLNPDIDDEYVDAQALKGKIDHSTAGAQWIWQKLEKIGSAGQGKICGQILALCIASHHSGLIDCLKPDGTNGFIDRMNKDDNKSNLTECVKKSAVEILDQANSLADKVLIKKMIAQLNKFHHKEKSIQDFYHGFWTRLLFSCLIGNHFVACI